MEEEPTNAETYLVSLAMKKLGITEKAAKLRVKALMKSGVLVKFGTSGLMYKVALETALRIPQLGEGED